MDILIKYDMDNNKIKHLEFIQAIVTRMNQNSFQLKGWMITIVSALLALCANSGNIIYIWLGIAPTILFWLLDAYYLQQERKFRGIYNDIAELNEETNQHHIRDFEMPIQYYSHGKYSYVKVLFSKTLIGLYVPVILGLIIAGIVVGMVEGC